MEQQHSNFLYSCSVVVETAHDPFVYEHVLAWIISGSAELWTGNGVEIYPKGALCLIRRNQLLKITKKSDGINPAASVLIFLDHQMLKKYSQEHNIKPHSFYVGEQNVLIENDDFMKGYFSSLMPYVTQPEKLTPILAQLKTDEIISLLLRNQALENFLFDFNEPHKIDLEAYMNKYFSYNVPLSQFAKLTGRSLSTFKRDFAKIYDITPEKWLQKKRLEHAYFLITQQKKRPSEIYLEVGFETLSHFSYAFKKQFGKSPNNFRI